MLSLANPSMLWLLLLIAPVVVLYFLRMRFRRQSVGSTFIWKKLAGKTSGGKVLRMRSLLLLALQCAAVALGALAAAGPVAREKRILRPGTAFLVDVSASMASDDEEGYADRVAAAAAAVAAEIDALGRDESVMVFACASGARALMAEPSLDKAAARASLRALAAGSEAFSEGSCADDLSAWLAMREESWRACLATDGGLDMGGRRIASVFDGAFRVLSVGGNGRSIGVSGLRLETPAEGSRRAAFSLWNGFPAEREASLVLERRGGGTERAVLAARPGWSRATIPLNGELASGPIEGAYTLRVERGPGEGGSAPGAECYLSVARKKAISVLLVGRDDPFLRAALAYGGIAVSGSASFPAALFDEEAEGRPDIVISSSAELPEGLRCDILCFGAVPPDAPVSALGRASGTLSSAASTHPLLRFVDWAGARTESGFAYRVGEGADVLATIGGKPAVVAWRRGGYRAASFGVDLVDSDLGLKSAFPVFLQNFIQWCVPRADEQSMYTMVAGETARRAEGASFRVEGAAVARDGSVAAIEASEAGFFPWRRRGASGLVAVNVPAGELDAAPRHIDAAREARSPASVEVSLERPLRSHLALLFLICVAAEWFLWRGLPIKREARS